MIRSLLFRTSFLLLAASGMSLGLTGCVTSPSADLKPASDGTVQRVYYAEQAEMERAIKQAINKYPPRIENLEAGIYETDYVKGDQRWQGPVPAKPLPNGLRYRILLHLVKGKSEKKGAIKVVITKQVEIMHDFFQEPEMVSSDGLEELTILYRISRELAIDRAIHRAEEKGLFNSPPPTTGK
jgi:hypothetical protein